MTKEEFISEVTKDLLPAPQYFPLNAKMNMEGYEHIDNVLESGTKPLSSEDFEEIANENKAIILDVRHQNEFAKGHVPKSIFIGIDGGFAPWAGSIIGNISQPILLVTPKGREKETVTRLARVGIDNTLGYLEGGTESWDKAGKNLDSVNSVDTDVLKQLMERDNIKIFDVRKPQEYLSEHVPSALSTPLDFINDHLSEFPSNLPFYVHCAGGYRSMITASILKRRGIHNIIDIKGGFLKIKEAGIGVSD
jgi:rhodanese-related sulfurtransferase